MMLRESSDVELLVSEPSRSSETRSFPCLFCIASLSLPEHWSLEQVQVIKQWLQQDPPEVLETKPKEVDALKDAKATLQTLVSRSEQWQEYRNPGNGKVSLLYTTAPMPLTRGRYVTTFTLRLRMNLWTSCVANAYVLIRTTEPWIKDDMLRGFHIGTCVGAMYIVLWPEAVGR